jgi:hypothetical protein
VGSALSPIPAALLQRVGRKFFSHILHGRVDCEEMIRRGQAIQKMIGGFAHARAKTGCFG